MNLSPKGLGTAQSRETITDARMRELLAQSQNYCAMILRAGPHWGQPDADQIIWEHGRRNLQLRATGELAIVCPVTDPKSEVKGLGIFKTQIDETRRILEDDPAVRAGVLTFDLYPCRSFPGDSLPDNPKTKDQL